MTTALVLSGGKGERLGSEIPKQYLEIAGKPIISYCLETLANHKNIDFIQIVAEENWREFILKIFNSEKFKGFSDPGKNRQLSIYNGLIDIAKYSTDDDLVLIHDAARPFVTANLIENCIAAAKNHDGALPVLPMKDTVYYSENKKSVTSLLNREKIFAGQAPEAFKFKKYLAANESLLPDKILEINGSTEPAILAGMDVALIAGDEKNLKITTAEDLKLFGGKI